jgi:putative flippase GtrA
MIKNIIDFFKKFKKGALQFFKFQLVAVIAYWVDFAVYASLFTYCHMEYIYAKMISYCVGVVISYTFNKSWTFEIRKNFFSKYLLKFIFISAVALTANLLAIYLLNTYYEVDPYLGAMAATAFSFVINFCGSKFWCFAGV